MRYRSLSVLILLLFGTFSAMSQPGITVKDFKVLPNDIPVGTKAANELGLYDMSGNVSEWCSDRYDRYSQSPQNNPTGSAIASVHVLRGGCWYNKSRGCRLTIRNSESPTYRNTIVGFRIVCEP